MKCTEVKKTFDGLAYGEISSSTKMMVESHLKACVSCQQDLSALQTIGKTVRQVSPIVAPILLDKRVLSAFQNHHAKKGTSSGDEKLGWFGIPRLAFATAFLALILFSALAFQLGKISATETTIYLPLNAENMPSLDKKELPLETATDTQGEKARMIVPTLTAERIVKVPIYRDRIVTKTVYLKSKELIRKATLERLRKYGKSKRSSGSNFQVTSDINPQIIPTEDTKSDFRIAPDLNPKVIKKGETNEK